MKAIILLISIFLSFSTLASDIYPNKTIKIIVGYPVGGGTDILARYFQSKLESSLGWNIIIENKPGASGMIGNDIVANSTPNGYTLLMGHITPNAINPGDFLEPKINANWNLEPIVLVAISPSILVVNKKSNIQNFSQLKSFLNKEDKIVYGSDGIGSLAHLQMISFLKNSKYIHSPYKGGYPALTAILNNEVSILFSPAPVSLERIRQGDLIAIAQTTEKRSKVLPNVPTLMELDKQGFESYLWWGLFAPKNTPKHILDLWHREIIFELNKLDTQIWLTDRGYEKKILNQQEFSKFVQMEQIKWKKVINSKEEK